MDSIKNYNLINSYLTSFVPDRFGVANKALYLNVGWVQIDSTYASININGEVTFSYWLYQYFAMSVYSCGSYIVNHIDLGPTGPYCDSWVYSTGSTTLLLNQWVHHAMRLFSNTFHPIVIMPPCGPISIWLLKAVKYYQLRLLLDRIIATLANHISVMDQQAFTSMIALFYRKLSVWVNLLQWKTTTFKTKAITIK